MSPLHLLPDPKTLWKDRLLIQVSNIVFRVLLEIECLKFEIISVTFYISRCIQNRCFGCHPCSWPPFFGSVPTWLPEPVKLLGGVWTRYPLRSRTHHLQEPLSLYFLIFSICFWPCWTKSCSTSDASGDDDGSEPPPAPATRAPPADHPPPRAYSGHHGLV
jgi:hypothetical protein